MLYGRMHLHIYIDICVNKIQDLIDHNACCQIDAVIYGVNAVKEANLRQGKNKQGNPGQAQ